MITETWTLKYGCAALVTIHGTDRGEASAPSTSESSHLVGCTCARCLALYGPGGRPPVETHTKGTP